jgi:hypothetical protein
MAGLLLHDSRLQRAEFTGPKRLVRKFDSAGAVSTFSTLILSIAVAIDGTTTTIIKIN